MADTAPRADVIKLLVKGNGKPQAEEFEGWKTVSVTRSMETLASSFSLTYSDRWLASRQPFGINAGDECEIRANDELVLTGYVDECAISYSKDEHTLSVTGRSRAADLIDCSVQHKTGHWTNAKLDKLARDVCEPFDVTVSIAADVDIGAAWPTRAVQEGESVFEFLERNARERGVMFTSTADGMLIIEAPGVQRAAGSLVLGQNILSGQTSDDWKDRYRQYVVKQNLKEDDGLYGHTAVTAYNSATDLAVSRYRPLTIIAQDPTSSDNIRKRAIWEANVRGARSRKFTYTVPGWTSDGKNLWVPNRVIHVSDAYSGVTGDMLLIAVTMTRDENGTVSQLQLMAKESYSLTPITSKAKRDAQTDWLQSQIKAGFILVPRLGR